MIDYRKAWLPAHKAEALEQAAMAMGLEQFDVQVFGKTYPMPRLTAWCCDSGQGYPYSGQETPAVPWPPLFLEIRKRLEEMTGREFPSCLVNHYRDGKDSVAWHHDDEDLFGEDMLIASLSLGFDRTFKVRHFEDKRTFELGRGDLLIFSNEWEHTIPKTKRPVGPRTNLTFRTMP